MVGNVGRCLRVAFTCYRREERRHTAGVSVSREHHAKLPGQYRLAVLNKCEGGSA